MKMSVLDSGALIETDPVSNRLRLCGILERASALSISLDLDILLLPSSSADWVVGLQKWLLTNSARLGFKSIAYSGLAKDLLSENDPSITHDSDSEIKNRPTPEEDTRPHFLADHATADDLLGYYPIAKGIASFVSDRRTALPLTVAVDGAWGTGKSSLMKMLGNELDPDRPDEATAIRKRGWWQRLKGLGRGMKHGVIRLWAGLFLSLMPQFRKKPEPATDRKFATVFVNAWRHGRGTQLKANIVNEVLGALTRRYGADFLVRLEFNRLDRAALLRAGLRSFFTNGVTLFIVGLFSLLLVKALWDTGENSWIAGLLLYLGQDKAWQSLVEHKETSSFIALFVNAFLIGWKALPAPKIVDYIEAPDYLALAGPDAQVERDFARMLAALRTRDRYLALFIDDLDRCSPAECAAVIEALNTFFGTDRNECLFVLGMHREMVAESLEVAYEKLAQKIDKNQLLSEQKPFGRRFLEKIVQFFVTLPEPDAEATERFLDALTSEGRRGSIEEIKSLEASLAEEKAAREKAARREATRGALQEAADKLLKWTPGFVRRSAVDASATMLNALQARGVDVQAALDDARKLSELKETIEDRKQADENQYVAVFKEVRPVLRANPRQYKRFFNELRFYRLMGAGQNSRLLEDALAAALALEHPALHYRIVKAAGSIGALAEKAAEADAPRDLTDLLAEADAKPGIKVLRDRLAATASAA
ncbi:MAG: hypothetical protein EP335_00465 [Alphaproteobacteria bacterium]|nr:MAG: hypothetical protein EP335_00465 [Alphaproteobacteria bacterium]